MRLNAIRAVDPDRLYPTTLFNVRINDEKYDLPLEHSVADAVAAALDGPDFASLDRFADASSIEAARAEIEAFNSVINDQPAFTKCDVRAQIDTQPRVPRGYICKHAFVNKVGAEKLLHMASSTRHFEPHAADFLNDYASFFMRSGGFELVRAFWYFDSIESMMVHTAVDGVFDHGRSLIERRIPRTRFSDTLGA
jgi:hypothetical protein